MFIYKISNIKTGDFYIGKTTKSIDDRFKRHLSNAGYGSNTYFHKAIRKYSAVSFVTECLCECDNVLELDAKEMFYIAELKPKYNMTAGGTGGDTSMSPNYKNGNQIHNRKKGKDNPNYGKKYKTSQPSTEERNQLISKANKERWANYTKEERLHRASKTTGSKNPMYGKCPTNSKRVLYNGIEYGSLAKAKRETGLSVSYLLKYVIT